MKLYICEKPSQAKDLAAVLGITKRGDGYLHDGKENYITWAFGHLLQMYMPQDYSDKFKSWSLDTLPISPESWKLKVKQTASKQVKVIDLLIKKAQIIYIATDYDREGEAIARSLMDRAQYSGLVKRVCLTALDDNSIRKALKNIKDGKETLSLYYAAIARQRADWLIGMNASRLYTVLTRKAGFDQTLHIGRVITPTIFLVCQRDQDITNFKASPFWTLDISVSVQNGHFSARWCAPDEFIDEQGRCINKAYAEQVAAQIKGAQAVISKAETKAGKESAPLPFDLTSLQQYASKRWGYTAQEVLDVAQNLYEKFRATSYPRTDCRYLPESQKQEANEVLQNLILSDQAVSGLVAGADTSRKSRVFNDKKITAHHAIIPTPFKVDISAMSEPEFNIYDAVRRFYIAQFYSPAEFSRTVIDVMCGNHLFIAAGKTPLKQGWKVLFNSESESSPQDEGTEAGEGLAEQDKLPRVNQGEPALISNLSIGSKVTRPSPHFTESSLLAAMENISRFVTEEKFKKILAETAGLGTPATRAGIIQGAVDKGYFKRQKKMLISTEKANALIAIMPPAIKSPGMTAAWEQELEKIASGHGNMTVFMNQITNWICKLVEELKVNSSALVKSGGTISKAFEGTKPATHECFNCGGELTRLKGSNGFFWGCKNTSCKKTFNDNRGKPVDPIKATTPQKNAPKCPECDSPMLKRKGKPKQGEKASQFWGCSNFPTCRGVQSIKPRRK